MAHQKWILTITEMVTVLSLTVPLVTVPLINSIVFASYEFYKNLIGVKSDADFTFS